MHAYVTCALWVGSDYEGIVDIQSGTSHVGSRLILSLQAGGWTGGWPGGRVGKRTTILHARQHSCNV